MRTVQTQVFKFAELTGAAKERAKAWYVEGLDNWFDSTFDDAKLIGALMGFEIENIYFSGFSSQGDGAKFEGAFHYGKGCVKAVKSHAPLDTTLHAIAEEWAAIQQRHFYNITGKVVSSGRYQHSGETDITVECAGADAKDEVQTQVEECLRSFMNWIYTQLEKEWDAIQTDEYIADYMAGNGYEFESDGTYYSAATIEGDVMKTEKPLKAVTLIFDGARGRYIPRDFVCNADGVIDIEHCAKWGLVESNAGQWGAAANPDGEYYDECWAWILDHAEYTDANGHKYRLHQDGDLWGLCYERMTREERSNFGFDDEDAPATMKLYDEQGRTTEVPYDKELLAIVVDGVTIYNPCRSPDDSAFCTPERYGFEVRQTGGGCLAWSLDLPGGGELLVTDDNGSGLPEEDDEFSPMLGRYDNEGNPVAAVEEFAGLPKNGS